MAEKQKISKIAIIQFLPKHVSLLNYEKLSDIIITNKVMELKRCNFFLLIYSLTKSSERINTVWFVMHMQESYNSFHLNEYILVKPI
ncbi:hypothetical protein SDC9_120419 [bioreactor metagenome]|uniref:Uncharacterized protein n=1 Tax=bioreactor metagenome TaxID=1076179 RepID=A0A645C717_9ZZZZ